jgi:putative DNA primase/helicase
LAKETVRSIYQEAAEAESESRRKELAKHATGSEAEARIRAMLELAKSEVPVSPDELDADPWVLNCKNGTVDLHRTGELMAHRREDLITKLAPVEYDPEARAPAWDAFLGRVLPGEELQSFVQRAAGYSLTGDTSEQCMFINHGTGANGKSTFQEAVSAALGDYAMRAPSEMLLAKRAGAIPNDIARLKGSRYVTASETEEGRRLAESLVKDLTGQDTVTARFMRAEFFDFPPTHKLWLSTNHKPEIRGTDTAIWRRIRLIPWSVTIPPEEQEKRLPATLRRELAGILAWAVRGCLEWQREGLRAPDEVRRATSEYRAEMDVLAGFLGECCETGPELWDYAKDLYTSYKRWCGETGERPETQRKFGERLRERGFQRDRGGSRGAGIWRGLRLSEEERARIEGMLTLQKSGISSTSDPPDPEKHITGGKSTRGS